MTEPLARSPGERTQGASRGAIVVGYGLALAVLAISLMDDSHLSWWRPLPGAIAVTILLATPPTIALFGLRHRPGMLLIAGVLGLLGLLPVISVLGYPLAVLGVIWLVSYSRTGHQGEMSLVAAAVGVAVLWLAASTGLWIHIDPVCEQLMQDGTVVTLDPSNHGFESGWTWNVSGSQTGSLGPVGPEVAAQACSSDVVTPLETLAILGLCSAATLIALSTTRRRAPGFPIQLLG